MKISLLKILDPLIVKCATTTQTRALHKKELYFFALNLPHTYVLFLQKNVRRTIISMYKSQIVANYIQQLCENYFER